MTVSTAPTATPCPGMRSPANPSGRLALCRACGRFEVLAAGVAPARRVGGQWVCDVAVLVPAEVLPPGC